MTVMTFARRHLTTLVLSLVGASVILGAVAGPASSGPEGMGILPLQVSTAPENGDLNPYGLAIAPDGFPGHTLKHGQYLVSNFNNAANSQGMGSTIVIVDPTSGHTGVFFQGTPPIGFTNALSIAREGFVFAGSVFTTDGSTGQPGPLLVFDQDGHGVAQLSQADKINGPWGMALHDQGKTAQLFVSNVFDGTITRLEVSLERGAFQVIGSPVTIASGYAFGTDPNAIVVGPAGLAYDSKHDVLYVAAEGDNAIFALAGAGKTSTDLGKGTLVFSDSTLLHGPLGLILAPHGTLITANADPSTVVSTAGPSELVEFTPSGQFVRTFSIDSAAGSAFAINAVNRKGVTQFSYVDDAEATLTVLRLQFD
jgi:DNA-binding beta-propeller fold protein YncE